MKLLLKNLPGNAEKAEIESRFSRRSCKVDHVIISGNEAIVTVANEESKIFFCCNFLITMLCDKAPKRFQLLCAWSGSRIER